MKKALFVVALLGSMVASADTDSYLYWMVGSGAPEYTVAKIRYGSDPDGYLTSYYAPNAGAASLGTEVAVADVNLQRDLGDGMYAGVANTYLPSSFIVELYNSGAFVGQSEMSWETAQQYLYGGGMGVPVASAASFSGFAIPEPSSGLLMLVGCAVLGLRRRKQKNA